MSKVRVVELDNGDKFEVNLFQKTVIGYPDNKSIRIPDFTKYETIDAFAGKNAVITFPDATFMSSGLATVSSIRDNTHQFAHYQTKSGSKYSIDLTANLIISPDLLKSVGQTYLHFNSIKINEFNQIEAELRDGRTWRTSTLESQTKDSVQEVDFEYT